MDMDWDDEDEKTSVYEKGGGEDAAHALLHAPVPPPAAGKPAPRPAPAAGAPPPPSLRSAPRSETPVLRRPPPPSSLTFAPARSTRKVRVALMVAALAAAVAVALFFVKPLGSGALLVTVAGPNNKAIDAVDITISDDTGAAMKDCSTSPCAAPKLKAGTYLVKVKANGYQAPAPEAVQIDPGKSVVRRITLSSSDKGTGIRVTAKGTGPFHVTVDGRERGTTPASVTELESGEHTVRVADKKDRYEPFEKKVTVTKGEMTEVNASLKVLRGLAKITPGQYADGARVVLVSGNERRPLPKIPIAIEIKLDKPYTLVATRPGFRDLEIPIEFDDGEAEKTFEVELTMAAQRSAAPAAVAAVSRATGRSSRATAAAKPAPAPAAPAAGGNTGTIAINSIPVSTVAVDGRPAGSTPTRWNGPAGTHTVTFIHPEFGRKSTTVTLKPGGTSVAAMRFP
jgi:hypothetical protein